MVDTGGSMGTPAEMPSASQRPVALVVDDDDGVRSLLRAALKREFDVVVCASGDEAWTLLHADDAPAIDVVVADFMMPGMTGMDLLQKLGDDQPHIARVLITASDRVQDLTSAVNDARVHRFISKPLRVKELSQLVWGALREVQLEAENIRLIDELQTTNQQLQAALKQVKDHERLLEEEVQQRTLELKEAIAELEQLALRDGLTGLYNHRHFQDLLSAEMSRAQRHQEPLSLLFLDVDHFKSFNDTNGHPMGDRLLKRLGKLLINMQGPTPSRRKSDIVARYGGEEFVVILPNTDAAGALVRAERLRSLVEGTNFEGGSAQPMGRVTVSVGVSAYPLHAETKAELIAAADEALYAAKGQGRNQVVLCAHTREQKRASS